MAYVFNDFAAGVQSHQRIAGAHSARLNLAQQALAKELSAAQGQASR
jgi:hypothetical protein